jgi:putative tryptophan/tyrosine transport system substrate-binding protein
VKRREFISLLGGAAAWPLCARAQQPDRMRRIGVLISRTADDPEYQDRMTAFLEGLHQLGWHDGRNVHIDIRRSGEDASQIRRYAMELVALAPDVIQSSGGTATGPLLQATRAIPVVFAGAVDPVGGGLVESLLRPGGNATGFMQFEYGLSGKWLQLLKEAAPRMTRAAVLRDPTTSGGIGQFAVIQSVAPTVGVDVIPVNVGDAGTVERTIAAFARSGNGGLIMTASTRVSAQRELVNVLAARYRLPTIYHRRFYVASGGLISYGPNIVELYRLSASYVDRILKGEKPADLPVQAPTKYELVINLKTARALGLEVPPSLLARADEVIE